MYGVALGPAIGWLYEGVDAVKKRNVASLQIIWNALEQYPGNEQIRAAYDNGADTGYMIRVPHSSGLLEGHYTEDTVFPENDHRRHRPRSWLINGVKKVDRLRFLGASGPHARTSRDPWLLREPRVMSVLPNIYDREQLVEFAGAPDAPALTRRRSRPNRRALRDQLRHRRTADDVQGHDGTLRIASGLAAMRKRIFTPNAPEPIGPYSQAIDADGVLFCSGQIPIDPQTGELVDGDVAAQTERALRNLEAVFKAAGKGFDDVVRTTIFLIDMGDFAAVNAVYDRYFGSVKPARSTVAVAALPKNARVEIDCVAL